MTARRMASWLTIAFIFTVPWEAAIQVGNVGRVSRALGLVAAAVWAVSVVLRGRLRQPDAFVKAYFLFLVWNGLTLYWAWQRGYSPLELVSPRADRGLVSALRARCGSPTPASREAP